MIRDDSGIVWPTEAESRSLAEALLAFYEARGRSLPWRGEKDLYRIWVSEIMLQQTGVASVIPYYGRFLAQFPTVDHLARADLSQVLHRWQGLGYYRRARHLHAAAVRLVNEEGGRLPEVLAQWQALPGVGPSTAAAILAIGRDQPHAILDGNVKRVLSRRLALEAPVEGGWGNRMLWRMARCLTPPHRPGDYAQAIMDLGATLCARTRPMCSACPWQRGCVAHEQGRERQFPVKKEKKKGKPHRFQWAVLCYRSEGRQELWMERRPDQGLLAGFWQPLSGPLSDFPADAKEIPKVEQGLTQRGLFGENLRYLGDVDHVFTHFHLTVSTFQADHKTGVVGEKQKEAAEEGTVGRWMTLAEVAALPCSTLHKKVLALGREKPERGKIRP